MPELPEVETIARILSPLLEGRRIVSITVLREKNIENPLAEFEANLIGKSFECVGRRAKFLVFRMKEGGCILSHLRMEGRYFYEEENSPRRKHDILYYHLDNDYRLAYCDTRKFGRIAYFPNEEAWRKALSKLGPEPFSLHENDFAKALAKTNKPIKEAIMDQSLIAGVGNIYADESLYKAKIHPLTKASDLNEKESADLLKAIQETLKEAISLGGSTIKSYHPKEGASGKMQTKLLAYGKAGSPCPRCKAKLKRIAVGGRGTTYCPLCQKEKNQRFVLGVLGPIHSGKSTLSSFLLEKGYLLFDADKEAKKLYALKKVKDKVIRLFPDCQKENGEIDFVLIRKEVAADPEKKKALNGIIFPLIKQKARKFISKSPQNSNIVLDVPLLFEADMGELCSCTVLILASVELRKKRLLEEGKDAQNLLALNQDYPIEKAKSLASLVLFNDGSLSSLKEQVDELFQ